MKNKEVVLNFGKFKKKILVSVVPFLYEGIGLMFKNKNYSKNLLFSFRKPTKELIHSLFVFHKFIAIWCDEKFNVLGIKIISPWKFHIDFKEEYNYLIEIPFKNMGIFSRRDLDEALEKFK